MSERKPHLVVSAFAQNQKFKPNGRGPNPIVPSKNRTEHGLSIKEGYDSAFRSYDSRSDKPSPVTDEIGIYVEIIGTAGHTLPLESLDTKNGFKLRSCRRVEDHEVAIVFVPESQRNYFINRLTEYLNPEKDGKLGPRNQTLVNSIDQIRLADLKSFWTDDADSYPGEEHQVVWWEMWLKTSSEEQDPLQIARELASRIGANLGSTSSTFFDSLVVLINASPAQLAKAPELIANLKEIRRAKETPVVLLQSSPKDQLDWIEDLSNRLIVETDSDTAITLFDGGINYDHPLLKYFCSLSNCTSWDPSWPLYDQYNPLRPTQPYNAHGSTQAGLAVFGDLNEALLSSENIVVNHKLESARILPPLGNNNPELYGAITVGTAEKLTINNPELRRVYSLAVTSAADTLSGQPSSWSAELDQYSFGLGKSESRLFVVSAGNNRKVTATLDYWDQVHLAQIEDPAQSWNALTVGAYTEKTVNDDEDFEGWSAFAEAGDIAPSSTSSVGWGWRKQAPYKPDVVAEGGNRLISPGGDEISNASVVELLTTSGRTTGELFDTSADTSAACAQVSRHAAILMAEYPDFWPETIRALIVHSAKWTPRMHERYEWLKGSHTASVAKEIMLKTVGYGVPDLERSRDSANHQLTLIAQQKLYPFTKKPNAANSSNPTIDEMQLFQIPWPTETLQSLSPDLDVKLNITLSYFVEPNPGKRGYRQRFSYQSHGLRFEIIRPGQSLKNFKSFVNRLEKEKDIDYQGPEGDTEGWILGSNLRKRGSLHSDTWIGPAASLAEMHTIAVYPVGGWWKYRAAENRWQNAVRYSVIVSIDTPDEEIDIYSEIEQEIELATEISI